LGALAKNGCVVLSGFVFGGVDPGLKLTVARPRCSAWALSRSGFVVHS